MPPISLKDNAAWTLLSLLCVLVVNSGAQQPPSREFQIKSVFLFNFTQFVEWPSDAFEDVDEPLVVGVLGEDPFGSFLDATVRNEFIDSHPLTVERYANVDDLKKCHILYIASKDKQMIDEVLEKVGSKPVLTVSDADGFTRQGGMIRFLNDEGRIRFRINVGATSEARLTISSKLLRLAEIVPAKK